MAREIITLDEVLKIIENLRGFVKEINSACYNIDLIVKSQSTTNLYPIKNFLLHYSYLAFMSCCINCYKIYSKSEKNSLPKLFNNLKNKKYDNKLNNRRLKYYAHTDTYSNKDSIIPPENLSEIKELNEFTIEIFNYLNGKFQFEDHLFLPYITSIEKVLNDREFVNNYYKGLDDENNINNN